MTVIETRPDEGVDEALSDEDRVAATDLARSLGLGWLHIHALMKAQGIETGNGMLSRDAADSVAALASDQVASEQAYADFAVHVRETTRAELIDSVSGRTPIKGAHTKAANDVARSLQQQLDRMADPGSAHAFGWFYGPLTQDAVPERYYIGNRRILTDDAEVIVYAWECPLASRYYDATTDDPGHVYAKRALTMAGTTVTGFEDSVYDASRLPSAMLGAVQLAGMPGSVADEMLADLARSRGSHMRDIVRTIESLQNQIMRSPVDEAILVQGAPGTGKTAIALHRVAWFLWNTKAQPSDVLVVGPSPTFVSYISALLPGLGYNGVHYRDTSAIIPSEKQPADEPTSVRKVKGELRMAGLLKRGLEALVGLPATMSGRAIGVWDRSVPRQDIEAALAELSAPEQAGTPYAIRRNTLRNKLITLSDRRSRRPLTSRQVEPILERIWPLLSPQAFLQQLFGSKERLLDAAGDDFTAGEVGMLYRRAQPRVSLEAWTAADLVLQDEIDWLINGTGHQAEYQHIVLDEAQDLSPMALRALGRRATQGSITILGDIAQSSGLWSKCSWDEVVIPLGVRDRHQRFVLPYGYRVPAPAFEWAERLRMHYAPDLPPTECVRGGEEVHVRPADDAYERAVFLAADRAEEGGTVAIICADSQEERLRERLGVLGADEWVDTATAGIERGINALRAAAAKGLEFDTVIVPEPTDYTAEGEQGLRSLYVALTRTIGDLIITHGPSGLPPELLHDAPPPPGGTDEVDEFSGEGGSAADEATVFDSDVFDSDPSLLDGIVRGLADQLQQMFGPESLVLVMDRLSEEVAGRRGGGPP